MSEYYFKSSDKKTKIHCVSWEPAKHPKAVLFIVHGMCESIMRYNDFASSLAKEGYLVAGHDLLGHGKSINDPKDYGYFADKNGNKILLRDIDIHIDHLREKYPDLPVVMLGHSMGSFLTRQYIYKHGEKLNGVIIMGTGVISRFILSPALLIIKGLARKYGWRHRSDFVQTVGFGSYNKRIKNSKTSYDWLTKDEKIVQKFSQSPENNFIFTLNGFYEMFRSMIDSGNMENISRIPKDLPIFLCSGDEDPVGDYGKGVERAFTLYKHANIKNIKLKLYKGDRHEILNELDRVVVYNDIMNWIDSVI